MTVTLVVDRIEGDLAVVEIAGKLVDWPLSALPPGTREGAKLTITFAAAAADTDDAEARLARLRAKTPQSGDIDL